MPYPVAAVRSKGTSNAPPWYLAGGVLASNCLVAYQPVGATSLAASYINLNNPGTNDAIPTVAPTWDSVNGWKFTGTQYISTGISWAANMSFIIRFAGASTSDRELVENATLTVLVQPRNSGTGVLYRNNNTSATIAGAMSAGTLAIAGVNGYRNGVSDTSALGNGDTGTIFIGGNGVRFITSNVQAFAMYNTVISAAAMLSIHTAASNLT